MPTLKECWKWSRLEDKKTKELFKWSCLTKASHYLLCLHKYCLNIAASLTALSTLLLEQKNATFRQLCCIFQYPRILNPIKKATCIEIDCVSPKCDRMKN